MTEAFVSHFAYALGDVTNTVWQSAASGLLRSAPEMLQQAGFTRHHICTAATTAYDLARRAVASIEGSLGDVDAIVYSTCIPTNGNIGSLDSYRETRDVKHLMDFPASRLQSEFSLTKAMVIGINQQACTGMLGSLYLAKIMIAGDCRVKRVLCITADRFPERSLYEQAYNLISDGAAACVVSTEPEGFRILTGHAVTNGALSFASDDETVGSFFTYSHRVIHDTIEKAGLTINDIDWIVPQNTNGVAWQILSKLLPFDPERVYHPTLGTVGHVISGDNIINLKYLADRDVMQNGEKVLLFMAGYGLNWQSVILEKV
jgi:3-oxoacyl-[acyl-carrier-protein] synthase-3